MFFFKKPEEKFEFLFVKGIMLDEISSTLDFVNFIDSENARLTELGETGSLVAVKYIEKRNKKIIYAQQILLPVAPEVELDDYLNNFYAHHPIAFDESILTNPPVIETEKESTSTKQKADSQVEEPIKVVKKSVYTPQSAMEEEIQRQREEIEALKALLVEQQTQVAQVVEDSTSRKVETSTSGKAEHSTSRKVEETTILSKPSTTVALSKEMDTDVEEMLALVKSSYQEKVQHYLEEERQKILGEMKELDQRDKIEAQVTNKLNKQKQIDLQVLKKELAADLAQQIEVENKRHEEALKQLELINKKTQAAKEVEIEEAYKEKIAQTIQEEYETQTIQLERILQGKTDELQLRQKEMNKGLKADFEIILQTFNQGHERVIQLVEAQKKEKKILSFPEKVRKKA